MDKSREEFENKKAVHQTQWAAQAPKTFQQKKALKALHLQDFWNKRSKSIFHRETIIILACSNQVRISE